MQRRGYKIIADAIRKAEKPGQLFGCLLLVGIYKLLCGRCEGYEYLVAQMVAAKKRIGI